MKQKKGLVISWFYPPGNSSEGLVTYKLLRASGYQYDVFTRSNQNANVWDRDVVEKNLEADNVNIIGAKSTEEEDWIKEAVAYYGEHKDEYDFVMTRIMPVAAHEVGLRIKAKFPEVKWIASYGDPISNTPCIPHRSKEENPLFLSNIRKNGGRKQALRASLSPLRPARAMVWELRRRGEFNYSEDLIKLNDKVVKEADVVILNNPYERGSVFSGENRKYRGKSTIIKHSFEPSLYEDAEKEDDKLHFVYTGHLDDRRNATGLMHAIARLKKHDPNLADKVVFDFYGHVGNCDKAAILDGEIYDIVRLHDDIEYAQSLKEMRRSDWLVLIDMNLAQEIDEYIYFPAKLADYLGAGRKILAITQVNGATADIVRETNSGVISTHSDEDIYLHLASIIAGKYDDIKPNQRKVNSYSSAEVAKKLDAVIDKLLA